MKIINFKETKRFPTTRTSRYLESIDYTGYDFNKCEPVGFKFSTVVKDIDVSVSGQSFLLPTELGHIKEEIEYSKYILELESDWDGDDAPPVDKDVYLQTVKLLIEYSKAVLTEYGVIIEKPEINPCIDNSIDISWRTRKMRMLFNIKKRSGSIRGNFYGDFHDPQKSKQGFIDLENFDYTLVEWMKELKR